MSTNYLLDAAKAILEQRDQTISPPVVEPVAAVADVVAEKIEETVTEPVIVEMEYDLKDEKKKKDEDKKDEDEDEEEAEEAKDKKDMVDEAVTPVAPVSLRADVEAFLASETNLSEEFKTKVTTIYEARIADKTAQITEAMEVKHRALLDEAVASITQTLTEQTDAFLNDVTSKWMEENALAVDTGLRAELTEDFIQGMKNLFAEHYIDLPAEKLDVVTEMSTKIESLEESLKSLTEQHLVLTSQLKESQKVQIIGTVCEGLTQTQTEKVRSLVESAEFTTDGEYRTKVEVIRENYFPSTVKKAESDTLNQIVDSESTTEHTNSVMAAYAKSITQLNK